MSYFKLFSLLFLVIGLNSYGQIYGVVQPVAIEAYRGKNFILEGKIYYKDQIEDGSYAVLGAHSYDAEGNSIKTPIFNRSADDYYRKDEWSPYELSGKIEKGAKYLGVMVAMQGNGSYYLDDFRLFVKDGKEKIQIPLLNPDFESDSLEVWQKYNFDKSTKVGLSTDQVFSGSYSLFIDNSNVELAPTFGNNPKVGKYLDVNGVQLYYEVYGEGEPLLLLNGNNTSMARFNNQLEVLRENYMVIGLDSRGQGRSTVDSTKITYELMAEDVNTFLDKMQLKKVNILGWSDGGNIAVILAMAHPDKVNKMAIMGTALYNDDSSVTPETNKLIRKQVKEMEQKGVPKTSMAYRMKMLLLTEPNINPDALQKIKAPTLVMAGQHDVIKEQHTKLIAEKIPNSKLVIFKGAGHEAPEEISELFNDTVLKFFTSDN